MDITSNLPNEILFNILAESAPYHSAFIHDMSLDSYHVWLRILRHKKSLLLVCKRWNNLASVLLFRHVVLRHLSQLVPFIHTLSSSRFASMVQELTLAEGCSTERTDPYDFLRDKSSKQYLESQRIIQEHQNSIAKIPQLCPRLKRLSLRAYIPTLLVQDILANPNLFHITEFHFQLDDLGLTFNKIQPWLAEAACRIHQLSFAGFTLGAFPPTSSLLEFPNLEELRIDKRIDKIPVHWSLPRLKRLILNGTTLRYPSRVIYAQPWVDVELTPFLRKNGSKIEYLSLLGCLFPTDIYPILSLCPKVQRLALDILPVASESFVSFPSIKQIDVYPGETDWTWDMEREAFADSARSFPSLQSIQTLGSGPDVESILFVPTIEVGPIQAFKEACTWLGDHKIIFEDYTLERGVNAGRISVLSASFRMDEMEDSDEGSTCSPTSDS